MAGRRGAKEEAYLAWFCDQEQRSEAPRARKPAGGLLPLAGVGSFLTAHIGIGREATNSNYAQLVRPDERRTVANRWQACFHHQSPHHPRKFPAKSMVRYQSIFHVDFARFSSGARRERTVLETSFEGEGTFFEGEGEGALDTARLPETQL